MTTYLGSCHCGAVRFRLEAEITELTTCDGSLCVKRNAVMARVPDAALTLTAGEEVLALYPWNTRRAQHRFCRICGVYVFHRKRSAPDQFGVNVFCLDGFDPASVPVRPTDGATMSVEDPAARPDRPGPRSPSGA